MDFFLHFNHDFLDGAESIDPQMIDEPGNQNPNRNAHRGVHDIWVNISIYHNREVRERNREGDTDGVKVTTDCALLVHRHSQSIYKCMHAWIHICMCVRTLNMCVYILYTWSLLGSSIPFPLVPIVTYLPTLQYVTLWHTYSHDLLSLYIPQNRPPINIRTGG